MFTVRIHQMETFLFIILDTCIVGVFMDLWDALLPFYVGSYHQWGHLYGGFLWTFWMLICRSELVLIINAETCMGGFHGPSRCTIAVLS